MTDDEIDLFGEITEQEEQIIKKRQEENSQEQEKKLNDLLERLPKDRSMRENSWVFAQQKRKLTTKLSQPFIQPNILSLKECQYIVNILIPEQLNTSWTTYRHSAFPTIDIPIKTTPCLQYLIPLLYERLIEPIISPFYGFGPSQLGFRDLFLVLYEANNHPSNQTGLAPHTDGSLISFNILINSPHDFEGGGTFFFTDTSNESTMELNNYSSSIHPKKGILIKPSNTGDCVIHCGKTMHQGVDITKGKRMIIVGFIETFETIENDTSSKLRNM